MSDMLTPRKPRDPQAQVPTPINPAASYIARLARSSRRVTMDSLNALHDLLLPDRASADAARYLTVPWQQLRAQHTRALRAALTEARSRRTGKALAAATINRHIAALRGVLKEAFVLGLIGASDYQRACSVPVVKGQTLPAGRALTPAQLTALFQTCRTDPGMAGLRDGALFAVLYGGGLRRAEAAALQRSDYEPATGELVVRYGKGNKARKVWLNEAAGSFLERWLRARGDHAGPLFGAISRWGHLGEAPLTPQGIFDVVRRRAAQAGVAALSPHDFRRTFVSDLLDAGADLATVQRMAGHASVGTTAKYDRRGDGAARRAAELLRVPRS